MNERLPEISGWSVASEDERTYTATRRQRLTAYQRRWGAVSEVKALTAGELWLLCDAQTRLVERLAVAEVQRAKSSPQQPELHQPATSATARS